MGGEAGVTRLPLHRVVAAVSAGTSVNSEDRPCGAGEIGVLKTSAVAAGHFLPDEHKAITVADRPRASCPVQAGTIIVSRMNTKELVGESGFVDQDHPALFLPDRLWALTPARDVWPRWLGHLLASDQVRSEIGRRATGTSGSMKNLSQPALLGIEVHVPSLPEQRRIAAVLDAWDAAIALNERFVAAKQRRRDGVRQELMAPAFSAKMRRDGWSRMSITDLADIRGGGTPSSGEPTYWNGDVVWCTPTDLTGLPTRFLGSTAKTITQQGLRASAASVLPAGSIILCSRASVGECAISMIPMATNQGFQSLVPHHAGDAPFLYHLMRHAKSQLLRISAGSTFLEFGRNELRRMKVALPEPALRAQIGSALDALTDEIDLLAARTDLLRTQKRGLMQRLLTGRTRVPETIDALMPAPPREATE